MEKIFTQSAVYHKSLAYIKVLVVKINENPRWYYILPYRFTDISDYSELIAENFSIDIPKKKTFEGLYALKNNNPAEIEYNMSTYKFELISGAEFNKKYVKET
jgi:hypothetical protein